ncbi:MAG: hypothetical protein ACEPO2_14515 [Pelagibaca sp.]
MHLLSKGGSPHHVFPELATSMLLRRTLLRGTHGPELPSTSETFATVQLYQTSRSVILQHFHGLFVGLRDRASIFCERMVSGTIIEFQCHYSPRWIHGMNRSRDF